MPPERRQLEILARRLDALVEHSRDAIIGTDRLGLVTHWNRGAEDLLGYTSGEIVGSPLTRLLPRGLGRLLRVQERLGQGRRLEPFETVLLGKGGRSAEVSITVSPLHDAADRCVGAALVARDLTALRHGPSGRTGAGCQPPAPPTRDCLELLAGGVVHDFRNIIMSILSHADLVGARLPADSALGENLEVIRQGAQRAVDLCRLLLDYAGDRPAPTRRLSLNLVVGEVADLLGHLAGTQAELRFDLQEDLPLIEANATQMLQVVMNLVINSVQALDGGRGTVTIATRLLPADRARHLPELAPGDHVQLEVADTGRGIGAETLARIYEPYYTTKPTGHGIGLATVFGLIRRQQGVVQVSSEPGRGTRFTLYLPCAAAPGL